jgi:hypothetical protein
MVRYLLYYCNPFNFLQALSVAYSINLNWIVTGEGEMYRQPAQQPPARDTADAARTPEQAAMLAIFRQLPPKEQAEVVQLAGKEAELVEMRQRLAELERKTA